MPITARIKPLTVTIASGTTTEIIDLENRIFAGIRTPAGIASSSFTILQASNDTDDFLPLYNGNSQFGSVGDVVFTVEASKSVLIPVYVTAGASKIKLQFNVSETNKTFELLTREVN